METGEAMNTPFETFKTRAEAVSAEVHRFADRFEAMAFIRDFLREAGVSSAPQCGAVWAPGSFLDGTDPEALGREVPGLGFQVSKDAAAGAKVGISQLDWGMADTGTLVQDATEVAKRLVSTLPPIHIAILGTERILADMDSVLKHIHPEKSPYISFITGPSRTADIERVLTIGVHGPGRLIIVVVDAFERVIL
jgi:L-lactate dehydrogenase complex protein LldG